MQRKNSINNTCLPSIVGLLGVFIVTVAVFFTIQTILDTIFSLNNDVAISIVFATTSSLVSVFTVIWDRRTGRKEAIAERIRDKKAPLYEDFIIGTMKSLYDSIPDDSNEIIGFFRNISPRLMVWSAPEVITTWVRLRVESKKVAGTYLNQQKQVTPSVKLMYDFEDFIKVVRKDLGHKDDVLNDGDILSLFITDMEQYSRPK